MHCVKCKQETPDTEAYCIHCGFKMDVTFEEITKKLSIDNKQQKEEETEAFARWCLVIGIVVFVSGMIFRSLWTNPPYPDAIPNYVPLEELPHKSVYLIQPEYIKQGDVK